MFNPTIFENSRPGGVPVLEVLGPDEAGSPRFVPLKRTELRGEVVGPLADLRLTLTFGYTRAQFERVLEAVYRFPLPGDAAVRGALVRFGEVEVRAELAEREIAEREYQAAKQEGRQAALATRESPDVFTLHVAGLQPDQDVIVETSFVQLARPEGAGQGHGWSLRLPLTTAPRYVREDELGSRHAAGQPLALLRDPGHRFALDLVVQGAASVDSPTHQLDLADEADDRLRVRLREGEVLPDRDCVLAWRPRQEQRRPALWVALHDEPGDGLVYFLALVAPPARGPEQPVGREVVVLVDHSGSMEGPKWEAADWAVKQLLAGLRRSDEFALGVFHNTTTWFVDRLHWAEPDLVQQAVRFLETHRDSGGTNLGAALEQALAMPRGRDLPARHVLVVTDAEVSDEGRILRLASEQAERPDGRRVSVLCIDAAPNATLATELAERSGGVARFLTSDPDAADITTALDDVLADWAAPVAANLRLEIDRPSARAAGRLVRAESEGRCAVDLGDLPTGRAIWAVGWVPREERGELTFRLTAGGRELGAVRLDLAAGHDRSALKALLGARQVFGLELLISAGYEGGELRERLARLGYDPDEALGGAAVERRVYAENARRDQEVALKRLLVREALRAGLASSETAFVATRTEAGRRIEGTVVVANALPAGWSKAFLPRHVTFHMGGFAGGLAMPASAGHYAPPPTPGYAPPPPDLMMSVADSAFMAFDAPGDAGVELAGPMEQVTRRDPWSAVFAGLPALVGGEAVLFDSTRPEDAGRLPAAALLERLRVRITERGGADATAAPGLELLLFVGDLAAPLARVRLADLARAGGERPLNLRRRAGQVVRVVLVDRAGVWAASAPRLEVALLASAA